MNRTLTTAAVSILASSLAPASVEQPAPGDWQRTFNIGAGDVATAGESPYFILKPGSQLTLEGKEDGKTVRLVVTVLDETKIVGGIEARVVEERESEDGALVEVSRNFMAIHKTTRDVYYLGEEVDIYKNGKVARHEGAWESGKNGARFGLMVPGHAEVGARFYQEIAPGVAMDRARIVAIDASIRTPAGEFKGCLEFVETTPLEPLARDTKIYAPGIGLVKDGSLLLVEHGRKEKQ